MPYLKNAQPEREVLHMKRSALLATTYRGHGDMKFTLTIILITKTI